MPLPRTCALTGTPFTVEDEDLAFLEKISPVFGGKKYLLPPPTLCPTERHRRRLAQLNDCKLYKRTCSATGKSIVATFPPDSPLIVYEKEG